MSGDAGAASAGLVAWIGLYHGASASDAAGLEAGLAGLGFRPVAVASTARVILDDGSSRAAALEAEAGRPVAVAVPGGPGAVDAVRDVDFLWTLRRARRHVAHFLAAGSGVVPLAAAGLCRHRRVAAPAAIHDRLAKAGFVTAEDASLVVDGPLISAQGPDVVRLLLERLAMEMRPHAPTDRGRSPVAEGLNTGCPAAPAP